MTNQLRYFAVNFICLYFVLLSNFVRISEFLVVIKYNASAVPLESYRLIYKYAIKQMYVLYDEEF
jgi:hypothetical protein